MGYIPSKKTMAHGILFDSDLESQYYTYLLEQPNIEGVIRQPQYTILEPFQVDCSKCRGKGKKPSPKTGRPIKCQTCKGTGERTRQGMIYTADFKVIYKDGYEEVIDVKGKYGLDKQFVLRKKLWEERFGTELIVVTKNKKGEWVRK